MTPRTLAKLDFMSYSKLANISPASQHAMVAITILNEWGQCRVSKDQDVDLLLKKEHWDEIRETFHDRDLSTACVDALCSHAMTPRTLAELEFVSYTKLTNYAEEIDPSANTLVALRILNEWGRVRVQGSCYQPHLICFSSHNLSIPRYQTLTVAIVVHPTEQLLAK